MIEEITLKNYAQFRGEHTIDLRGVRFLGLIGPNWSGKTHLVEAILIALYGRTRSKSQPLSELVSWGETHAEVGVRFGGPAPFRIVRKFTSTGTTSEVVMDGLEDARKKDVVANLDQRLGVTHDDLISTAFVRQASLLGLAELDPAPLRAMFARWTDRPEWPALYKRATGLFKSCDVEIAAENVRAKYIGPAIADLTDELRKAKAENIDPEIDEEAIKDYRAEKDELPRLIEETTAELARLREKGLELKKSIAGEARRAELKTKLAERTKAVGVAEKSRAGLTVIQSRGFDGVCPVDPDETCPIASTITANLKANQTSKTKAETAVRDARKLVEETQKEITQIEDDDARLQKLRDEYTDLDNELDALTRREADILGKIEALLHPVPDPKRAEEKAKRVGALESQIAAAEEAIARASEAEKKLTALRRRRAALAFVVFAVGKGGIPAAESGADLAWIEQDATSLLSQLGLEFGCAFREERELQKWCSQCPACGDIVDGETCTCGLPRQREKKDELRIVVTFPNGIETPLISHSGGGQAFVAFALRVGAFRLLRARRACTWGTMILDEVRRATSPEMGRTMSHAISRIVGNGIDQVIDIVHGPEQSAADRVLEVVPVGTPDRPRSELKWRR